MLRSLVMCLKCLVFFAGCLSVAHVWKVFVFLYNLSLDILNFHNFRNCDVVSGEWEDSSISLSAFRLLTERKNDSRWLAIKARTCKWITQPMTRRSQISDFPRSLLARRPSPRIQIYGSETATKTESTSRRFAYNYVVRWNAWLNLERSKHEWIMEGDKLAYSFIHGAFCITEKKITGWKPRWNRAVKFANKTPLPSYVVSRCCHQSLGFSFAFWLDFHRLTVEFIIRRETFGGFPWFSSFSLLTWCFTSRIH